MGEYPKSVSSDYSDTIMVSKNQNTSFIIESSYKYSHYPILNNNFVDPIHTSLTLDKNHLKNAKMIMVYCMPSEIAGETIDIQYIDYINTDVSLLDNNVCLLFKMYY